MSLVYFNCPTIVEIRMLAYKITTTFVSLRNFQLLKLLSHGKEHLMTGFQS